MHVNLNLRSGNEKTGPIPVSTTSNETCPDTCPFMNHGCYAENFRLGAFWRKVSNGTAGVPWDAFIEQVSAMPDNAYGNIWRHNQAGDLPGVNTTLDTGKLAQLVQANAAAAMRGFTYTHKPLRTAKERKAIADANAAGFTINLSGNSPAHADTLADLQIGPVVTVLTFTPDRSRKDEEVIAEMAREPMHTPAGRRIVVCPATYREDVTCASCQLCQRAERKTIVGFPAHGQSRAKASQAVAAAA